MWPTPGKHVYAQLLNLWALVDVTDDYGAIWDTQGHVVPAEFWSPETTKKVHHTGDESWLEYTGKWGNRGHSSCWWHFFVGICQLLDGPPGPNRKFGYPTDVSCLWPAREANTQCIMGEATQQMSTYSFFLSRKVIEQAEILNVTTIVVEQVCARPNIASQAWAETLTYDDLEIWPMSSEIAYRGADQYRTTMAPCDGSRSAAKAYRLVMRDRDGDHVSTSPVRVLCIFEEGRDGWIPSSAAKVEDLDEWRWNLFLEHPKPEPPKETDPINNPA